MIQQHLMRNKLKKIYKILYKEFGPQYWWPGDSQFEVAIGAILTQNTNWQNVEKAINNLKNKNLLSLKKLYKLSFKKLADFIRPTGYYNLKAQRIKFFLHFLKEKYKSKINLVKKNNPQLLRRELLDVNGIGPETADSMLLYAFDKPIFVIDAYTKRIFSRHDLIPKDFDYQQTQDFFMQNLPKNTKLFNEYHALLVKLGKEFCTKNKPKCQSCPLKTLNK